MILDMPRRFRVLAILCIFLVATGYLFTSDIVGIRKSAVPVASSGESGTNPPLSRPGTVALLQPADLEGTPEGVSEECASRYDDAYLRAYSKRSANYCSDDSASQLHCFSHGSPGKQIDTFCTAGPLSYMGSVFSLNCSLRGFTEQEKPLQLPQYHRFPQYWYSTGPRYIFSSFVQLEGPKPLTDQAPTGFAFMVKREDNNQNLWHTMMEIMSLTMSIDVLSITEQKSTPMFTKEDRRRSQVVLLDNLPDGPYYELWSMFAGQPTARLADFEQQIVRPGKILVPLPGGSNPFWAGDWEDVDCGQASLFKRFSKRVLDFYGIERLADTQRRRLTLTFILRKQKRRLIDEETYFDKLKTMYPQVDMKMIDYAALSFAEQIKLSHSTDILVGVHGAGLTHGAFMPGGSTLVEILPPTLNHKGFKNMAKFLGHEHFSVHAQTYNSSDSNGDWQHDDLTISEKDFFSLLSSAINAALARQSSG